MPVKKFAVIGNPVQHSLSPALHNYVFQSLGMDAEYSIRKVQHTQLSSIIQELKTGKLDGINITIPHKEKIIPLLDNINARANVIGAVNVISRFGKNLTGNNTDWYGFSKALEKNSINVEGREIILLGAGGASKAVIFALKQLGVCKIYLLNRSVEKAEMMSDDLVSPHPLSMAEDLIYSNSIIINTSSVGMQTSKSPVDLGLLHKNQIIIDIIYNPLETPLINFGKKLGAKTMNGLDMFIWQGLASLDLWFGVDISKQVNFNLLKEHIETKLC